MIAKIFLIASALIVSTSAIAQQRPKDPCKEVVASTVGAAAFDALVAKMPRRVTTELAIVGDMAFGEPAVCGKDAQGKDKTTCAITAAEIADQRQRISAVVTWADTLTDPKEKEAYRCAVVYYGGALNAALEEITNGTEKAKRANKPKRISSPPP